MNSERQGGAWGVDSDVEPQVPFRVTCRFDFRLGAGRVSLFADPLERVSLICGGTWGVETWTAPESGFGS